MKKTPEAGHWPNTGPLKNMRFFVKKMREADYWPDAGLLKKIGVAPMGGKNDGASCPYLIYYIIYFRVVG